MSFAREMLPNINLLDPNTPASTIALAAGGLFTVDYLFECSSISTIIKMAGMLGGAAIAINHKFNDLPRLTLVNGASSLWKKAAPYIYGNEAAEESVREKTVKKLA